METCDCCGTTVREIELQCFDTNKNKYLICNFCRNKYSDSDLERKLDGDE